MAFIVRVVDKNSGQDHAESNSRKNSETLRRIKMMINVNFVFTRVKGDVS